MLEEETPTSEAERESVAESTSPPPVIDLKPLLRIVAEPMFDARGWVKLVAVLSILIGVLYCITIVGAVVGWLPIWLGVSLFRATDRMERAYYGSDKYELLESLDLYRKSFMIQGITLLVMMIVPVLVVILALSTPFLLEPSFIHVMSNHF